MYPSAPDKSPPSVEEAARRRREPRAFDASRPLDAAALEGVLAVATLAPSPFDLQPWRFLVIRDEADRRRLKARARNDPRIAQAPAVVVVLGYHHPDRTHLEPMLTARTAAGDCSPARAAEIRGRATSAMRGVADRASWATRWAMPAATLLVLAAQSAGMASVVVETFDDEAVRREFGIPDDHSIACLIALGHAVDDEPPAGRLGLDEVCFAGHFGRPWGP
ncbi:nitroreductase family protein [Paludisphaera sp.]|uniref:nitroreductase family protein n=1 Tax=Paludisphaera sp. TaxID=2017432 RepID=UPI00301D1DC0